MLFSAVYLLSSGLWSNFTIQKLPLTPTYLPFPRSVGGSGNWYLATLTRTRFMACKVLEGRASNHRLTALPLLCHQHDEANLPESIASSASLLDTSLIKTLGILPYSEAGMPPSEPLFLGHFGYPCLISHT